MAAAALAFAWAASALPAGAPSRLGPADVPLALAATTALAALVCLLRPRENTIAAAEADPCAALERVPLPSLLRLLGAVVLFAATIGPLGLMLAGSLCVALAARATIGSTLLGALVAGAGTTAICAIVFVGLVGQPLPLWPPALAAVWR